MRPQYLANCHRKIENTKAKYFGVLKYFKNPWQTSFVLFAMGQQKAAQCFHLWGAKNEKKAKLYTKIETKTSRKHAYSCHPLLSRKERRSRTPATQQNCAQLLLQGKSLPKSVALFSLEQTSASLKRGPTTAACGQIWQGDLKHAHEIPDKKWTQLESRGVK